MLQSEFEERVGINVSHEEYVSIEKDYMECELEKDEFCAKWVKRNAKRIQDAKSKAKEIAKKHRLRDKLLNIIHKVDYYRSKHVCSYPDEPVSADFFSKSDWKILTSVGIGCKLYSDKEAVKFGYITPSGLIVSPHARISDTAWQVHKYLFQV